MTKKIPTKIKLKGEQINKLINWMFENVMLRGDIWLVWWNEHGKKDFLDYAKKRGFTYMEEVIDGTKS